MPYIAPSVGCEKLVPVLSRLTHTSCIISCHLIADGARLVAFLPPSTAASAYLTVASVPVAAYFRSCGSLGDATRAHSAPSWSAFAAP